MSNQLKVGDVVKFKAGGPAMAVTEAGPNPTCTYFSERTGKYEAYSFIASLLVACEPSPSCAPADNAGSGAEGDGEEGDSYEGGMPAVAVHWCG